MGFQSKWLKMLLNEGVDPVTNKIVVPKSAFSAVTTASAIVYGKSSAPMMSIVGYGMGWMRLSYMGREAIFHTGGIPGSSTIVLFFPHEQLGMAVLLNAGDKPLLPLNIALKVATTAFGLTDQIVPFECVCSMRKGTDLYADDLLKGPLRIALDILEATNSNTSAKCNSSVSCFI